MRDVIDLIGRVFLSFIFFYDAYDTIFYFKDTRDKMTEYGLTWNQDLLLYGSIFLLIFGGTMLLIGYRASLGALLLLLYWVPLTFIVHAFWNEPEPIRRLQGILFMKNIAITGGLLMVLVNGSGKISVRKLVETIKIPKS
ncbi:MAG: DoxX family protein [Saprospiraceae bacterium]|jgi:putative oxidoreductase|nr:DoxX family protein [Saprospiraceae bacterium]MDP4820699.1 DoxX family protein [Saprospiraceae bacterium]MDP4997377.1 DoxX family protein [Saprospiraceae bacterium]